MGLLLGGLLSVSSGGAEEEGDLSFDFDTVQIAGSTTWDGSAFNTEARATVKFYTSSTAPPDATEDAVTEKSDGTSEPATETTVGQWWHGVGDPPLTAQARLASVSEGTMTILPVAIGTWFDLAGVTTREFGVHRNNFDGFGTSEVEATFQLRDENDEETILDSFTFTGSASLVSE